MCLLAALSVVAACGHAGTKAKGICARRPVDLVPLTDLRGDRYRGFEGGLYPGGRNSPPARYLAEGVSLARQVIPRGPAGQPSPNGRIVLLSIGMSNAAQEFRAFERAAGDLDTNPQLTIVDGAQGGEDAGLAANEQSAFWPVVDQRLAEAGVSPLQVQAAWLKEAIARPSGGFPADARRLESDLRAIVEILHDRFPNLRLVYLSSRTYGGYARTRLNPEPYAYDSGFAVKWLVEQRIASPLRGPWLGWGPYLWTAGTKGRDDGLVWTCDDVRADGTHPSASGSRKVAELLLDFFTTDPTAQPWFRSK